MRNLPAATNYVFPFTAVFPAFSAALRPLIPPSPLALPSAFGGLAQPQPQPQPQPADPGQTPALYSAMLNVTIYRDERDAILARWNQLQAKWGVGKGELIADFAVGSGYGLGCVCEPSLYPGMFVKCQLTCFLETYSFVSFQCESLTR